MFIIHLQNNYYNPVTIAGNAVQPNSTFTYGPKGGSFTIESKGINVFNVIDLARKKVPGYELKQTWGVLFRYDTVEVYSRYEGNGEYTVTIDELGDIQIKTINGSSLLISLPGLTLEE